MRYYEAIFIAQPNLEHDELSKLINEMKDMFEKRGGEILYNEIMGKKRLAYPVQKQSFGTYILFQFQSDGAGNAQLNKDLELKDNILAHMIVRIDEDEIRKAGTEAAEIKEELKADTDEEPAAESEDETSEPVVDEQDEAEPKSDQEESPSDEQSPPSGEENLEPEGKE
ncbi:MAG: 30S ribosomal protein S6 [Fidelibacterota bacterium]|nr:MAG: 30S ribosomal protein S6 [Candidatus Neomarinimicrobiota bacterium]